MDPHLSQWEPEAVIPSENGPNLLHIMMRVRKRGGKIPEPFISLCKVMRSFCSAGFYNAADVN
jgi:hypothetical protein